MGTVDKEKNVEHFEVRHTRVHYTCLSLFLCSLVWLYCISSWVKERGCRAQTPTVNSWMTIDGKQLVTVISATLCVVISHSKITLLPSLLINTQWPSLLVQDWVGVFSDQGVAQCALLIPLSSSLHPIQPALPLLTLRWSTEAGAVTEQATVSYINTNTKSVQRKKTCFTETFSVFPLNDYVFRLLVQCLFKVCLSVGADCWACISQVLACKITCYRNIPNVWCYGAPNV